MNRLNATPPATLPMDKCSKIAAFPVAASSKMQRRKNHLIFVKVLSVD
jgi:hypothetical protein